MSTAFLLDANALIALALREHEHHGRVVAWSSAGQKMALCPVVEGALVRFLVRLGQPARVAGDLLRGYYASSRFEFWPDAVSYVDADLRHVIGHRQVTDAYLVSLALGRGGQLATFDRALAEAKPDDVTLIP